MPSTNTLLHLKFLLLLFWGLFMGLWKAWPWIFNPCDLKFIEDIFNKSTKEKISLRATLDLSSNYLLKCKNKTNISKLRLVSDSCFG